MGKWILTGLTLLLPLVMFSQTDREFWFAAPAVTNHTVSPSTLNYSNLNLPIKLYITTAEGPATVKVDQPANPAFATIIRSVNNDSAREIDLTPFVDDVENKPANAVLNHGLRITSNQRVNVLYEVQSPFNAATYTLAGRNALGYEFIIPAQSHWPNYPYCDPPARNTFDVVAVEDSTVVRVVPRQELVGHIANDTFAVVLNRGQTWSGRAFRSDSSAHLGGTFVFSDKPIAITVTDDAIFKSVNAETSHDIAGDQLYPRHLCGTEFITYHLIENDPPPRYLVYAFENATSVTFNDSSSVITRMINRGESTEFSLDAGYATGMGFGAYITATHPVLIYELNGAATASGATTSMQFSACILPPITCAGSKRVTFTRTLPAGTFNEFQWALVTKNGNQANFHMQPNWLTATTFKTVPGTGGTYVFSMISLQGPSLMNYTIVVWNTSGRFQLSAMSRAIPDNTTGYNKFAYFTDYSSLYLGSDRKLCPGEGTLLDAGYGRDAYLWNTGDTTQTIWVNTPGIYWVHTTDADCQLSDTIAVTYYTLTPVDLGPDRQICAGDSVHLNAGPGKAWYLWNTGETTQWVWVKNTGSFWVNVPDGPCTVSDTVEVVTTAAPSVTNNQLSKTICSGEPTSIQLTSGVSGTIFHWTAMLITGIVTGFSADSGLVINQTLLNSGTTPGVVTYHITPVAGNCAGPPVDFHVTVNPGDPVNVSIAASANNVCTGTPVTFTATPVNPGASPGYQWKINAVNAINANNAVFTYVPVNGDIVQCVLTSSNTICTSNNPATSNSISMVVNPLQPVSVVVVPSANPVCAGALVNFNATAINGGAMPVYQWKVNGLIVGTNSPNYSYMPVNGDAITCTLNSNVLCPSGNPAISNTVTMTVKPILPVGVSIIASSNPFCLGTLVTFTAIPMNSGTIPVFQWKVNGNNAGTNNPVFLYSPANNDVITCSMLSSETCTSGNPAQSNPVTMVVNATLPAGITIAASANPFCPGSAVTFTATPVNGGSNPACQWKVNSNNAINGNNAVYTYNPLPGDLVSCVMTSNLGCVTANPATSNTIIMATRSNPTVVFTSCFDTTTTINAKPFYLKGGTPLGGTYSGTGVNSTTGVFTPAIAGPGTHLVTYTYTNVSTCSASKQSRIHIFSQSPLVCGNKLTDIRDGKQYTTFRLPNGKCWMAENLDFGFTIYDFVPQTDNCIAERYLSPVTRHASRYQWDELMQYQTAEVSQGLCPPGWHVPSSTEWNELLSFYESPGMAGWPMMDTLLINGFHSFQDGFLYLNNTWAFTTGMYAGSMYWTSTLTGSRAVARGLNENNPSASRYEAARANAFAVRCLRD